MNIIETTILIWLKVEWKARKIQQEKYVLIKFDY